MASEKRQADGVWNGQSRIAVGRALLRMHPAPMSAAEIASVTEKDPSNTKKIADELVERGVLKHVTPQPAGVRAGRRAKWAFAFAPGERDRFAKLFGEERPAGLSTGQQLVFINAAALGDDLLRSLARPGLIARAAWSALCDGERQELAIAFEGAAAVDASLDLMAALSEAQVTATRATVSKVDAPAELLRWIDCARSITQ